MKTSTRPLEPSDPGWEEEGPLCGSPCRLGRRASPLGFPPTKWLWSLKEPHRCSLRPHEITLSAVVENGEYGHLGKSLCVGRRDRFVNSVITERHSFCRRLQMRQHALTLELKALG